MKNIVGDFFNISAVCPWYVPESQCSFTWYRNETGLAIVEGYDKEKDIFIRPSRDRHFVIRGERWSECANELLLDDICNYDEDLYDEHLDCYFEIDPYGYVD